MKLYMALIINVYCVDDDGAFVVWNKEKKNTWKNEAFIVVIVIIWYYVVGECV